MFCNSFACPFQERIQDFKLGGALTKIAPNGGRRENFGVFRMKNPDFTPKKSYFFQLRRGTRKLFGYFAWKITILRQKIIFFPILERACAGCPPPSPWIHPCFCTFSFVHCIVCPSNYGFWLPLWYLQTLLTTDGFCSCRNHLDLICFHAF